MSIINTVKQTRDLEKRFATLFEAHHDAVYRYCVRRLGPSDAEDAAADVFAVAWRRLDDLPSGDAGRAWLLGVAYKVVGNRYRSRGRQARLSSRLGAVTATRQESESTPSEEGELLLRALGDLSATDRELLRLASWDGLKRSEIAHVLGIKENAVDQRLHRARSRLKARFDRLSSAAGRIRPEEASR